MGQWSPYIRKFEAKYNLPPGLLGQVMRQESGGRAHITSPAGAIGLMQLMPGTARSLGVDPHDPVQNLEGGAKYLSQQLKAFGGSVPKALAAYNAGPGAVQKYNGIPPYAETRNYVKRITSEWQKARPSRPTSSAQPAQVQGTLGIDTDGIARKIDRLNRAKRNLNSWGITGAFFDEQNARLDDSIGSLNNQFIAAQSRPQQAQPSGPAQGVQVNSLGVPGKNPFKFWESKFGLKRSSSDYDAPGVHTDGSYHYRPASWGGVRGYDYGDAANDPKKFMQIGQAIKNNPNLTKQIGEAFYDPWGFYVDNGKIIKGSIGGHGDHLHLGY